MSDTGFFGSTLTQVYNFNGEVAVFPEEMRGIGPRTYVVGDGVEETSVPFNTDVTDNQILIEYNVTPPHVVRWGGSVWSGPRWSDLTDNVPPILYVELETNMAGLGAEDLRWTEDSIWLNWMGLSFNPDTFVHLTVSFAETITDGGNGADELAGTVGNDLIRGGNGKDLLLGGAGNDWLQGDNGPDSLSGEAGHDRLTGGAGPDRLDGGEGNDRIEGGADGDLLSGGPGADIFQFGAEDGRDRILDFEEGVDQLVFTDGVTVVDIVHYGPDTLLSLSSGASVLLVGADWYG